MFKLFYKLKKILFKDAFLKENIKILETHQKFCRNEIVKNNIKCADCPILDSCCLFLTSINHLSQYFNKIKIIKLEYPFLDKWVKENKDKTHE